jgi:hypothetical protein
MGNSLATIVDQAGGLAEIEKYIETKFLERRDYNCVMANSVDAQTFTIPEKSGQLVQAKRKGFFRKPEHVDLSNETADPASGAAMSEEIVKFPLEFIHEYVPYSTIANWTSLTDLEAWVNEDLPMALMRRLHQLTQNAFKVGRYQPGKYASDGTVASAFDTTAAATVTLYGLSFTFDAAKAHFANKKSAFAELAADDRPKMADLVGIATRMKNSGAPLFNNRYVKCVLSESMQQDLMNDDKYFAAVIRDALSGKGLEEGKLVPYKGILWEIDDEPFVEQFGAGGVRLPTATGPIHTAYLYGAKGSFAYTKLGSKSPYKPKFKVQDISKTGKEVTIGYTIPFQVGIVQKKWAATYTSPVSDWEGNE